MFTKQDILRKMEENLDRIKGFGVKRLGLFGSYVRGEQKVDSDIDLLVEFEKGMKNFDNYMGLKVFLEDLLGCKVDLVIYDSLKPQIKSQIMMEVEYVKGL